ncbi:MAG TPA: glucose 1-dehydrogenase [Solirubrobacterales bacterium]|nr:glucose 1-dehydrogenase [Solirubrobacterales bacterium]
MSPGDDFAGRVALVTGGSRGLGREIVRGFAAAGADVVIVGRRLESCEVLAEEIRAETGRRALPVACHVGDWDGLENLVERAYAEFGKVDVLVNNAGMSPLYGSLDEVGQALWDKVLAVNLRGPFRLAVLVGERMVAAGGGSIVNVSSASARHPTPDVIPYAAAKAGLEAVTVALAHGLGPTVRVNAVAPGTFFTDVSAHWDLEEFARRAERFALRRGGEPSEIVGAVLYLSGDTAGYTTGAILPVDGGFA